MSEEFTTTIAKTEAAVTGDRPAIHQTIEEGDSVSTRSGATRSYSDTFDREIPDEVLAKIDAFKKVVDEEPIEEVAVEATVEDTVEAAPVDPAKPAEPAPAVAPPAPAPDETLIRLEEANKRLVADLEAVRAAPASVPEHIAKLTKAAESYLDDDNAALRAFIAYSIGVDDPNSKEVDQELEFQYASLTAKSLGTNLDTSHLALRENARTRQLLARQKRERQVESQTAAEKAKAEAEAKTASTVHEVIGNRLQTVATDYPLLMSLAETISGKRPQEVLWRVIEDGFKTGRFDPKQTDDQLTEQAAKLVENHYQALVDKVTKAQPQPKPNPSTVPPSGQTPPAAPVNASKDRAPVPARNVTNADASVAPATPPAKTPVKPQQKPMTKEERKNYALRHLSK